MPAPKSGWALIDTGASGTCVDDQAAKDLELPVIGTARMTSASHADHPCNLYPVQISFQGGFLTVQAPRAMGANLAAQGLLAIIGRDVLQHCTLFYNGPTGQITLSPLG